MVSETAPDFSDPEKARDWYVRTVAWVRRFLTDAEALEKQPPDGVHPRLVQAQIDASRSLAESLKAQLADHERKRQGEIV